VSGDVEMAKLSKHAIQGTTTAHVVGYRGLSLPGEASDARRNAWHNATPHLHTSLHLTFVPNVEPTPALNGFNDFSDLTWNYIDDICLALFLRLVLRFVW